MFVVPVEIDFMLCPVARIEDGNNQMLDFFIVAELNIQIRARIEFVCFYSIFIWAPQRRLWRKKKQRR